MMKIKVQTARAVVGDTQSTAAAIDSALLRHARLCATVLEACEESKFEMRTTQRLLEPLSVGFQKMVEGRAQMTATVRELQAIQGRSNLREISYGCPGGPVEYMGATPTEKEAVD